MWRLSQNMFLAEGYVAKVADFGMATTDPTSTEVWYVPAHDNGVCLCARTPARAEPYNRKLRWRVQWHASIHGARAYCQSLRAILALRQALRYLLLRHHGYSENL